MKERPILFSAPMVRAILAGAKTQTRRVMKPQPPASASEVFNWAEPAIATDRKADEGCYFRNTNGLHFHCRCPYGQPGDRLWVRETHAFVDRLFDGYDRDDPTDVAYQADHEVRTHAANGRQAKLDARGLNWDLVRWRPSIHMPRWASRRTLEVTSVRVERLHEISEEDARAEGIERHDDDPDGLPFRVGSTKLGLVHRAVTARRCFEALAREVIGGESWAANPWVWVVSFRTVEGTR